MLKRAYAAGICFKQRPLWVQRCPFLSKLTVSFIDVSKHITNFNDDFKVLSVYVEISSNFTVCFEITENLNI